MLHAPLLIFAFILVWFSKLFTPDFKHNFKRTRYSFSELSGLNCTKSGKHTKATVDTLQVCFRFLINYCISKRRRQKGDGVENRVKIIQFLTIDPLWHLVEGLGIWGHMSVWVFYISA